MITVSARQFTPFQEQPCAVCFLNNAAIVIPHHPFSLPPDPHRPQTSFLDSFDHQYPSSTRFAPAASRSPNTTTVFPLAVMDRLSEEVFDMVIGYLVKICRRRLRDPLKGPSWKFLSPRPARLAPFATVCKRFQRFIELYTLRRGARCCAEGRLPKPCRVRPTVQVDS